ncbi:response regulator transcription factor [Cohnella soli]|uniref:Response regulator n=1 Tax=Cohnella soli TaxID=425005 RepID=A0ABW0HXC4_9BACL
MLKIAIADDEELVRRGLEVIISDSGRGDRVTGCYSNGEEALGNLLSADIDVLITDIRMPKLDGLGLIKGLREMNVDIPCIIVSGYNDFEYARKAIQYGVYDYLLKPIDPDEMFQCLDVISAKKYGAKAKNDSDDTNMKKVVLMVKQIIDKEYMKEFKLPELSQQVYLNPNYLSRLFKIETGINISDYLIHVRMERAKEMLRRNVGQKIYEVADAVGYTDSVFFQ